MGTLVVVEEEGKVYKTGGVGGFEGGEEEMLLLLLLEGCGG